jgi:Tubulin-tyrosine ligase family/IQ calmodulin-binding motif
MNEKGSNKYNPDRCIQSFQDIFSIPYSYNKCTPYRSNVRFGSEIDYFNSFGIHRQESEKLIYEDLNESDYESSVISSDSRSQLPCLKIKNKAKVVGLPYKIEINKARPKKIKTSCNWFPNVHSSQKIDEQPKSNLYRRPATCSSSHQSNSSKKPIPPFLQASGDLKSDTTSTARKIHKNKRVIMRKKSKIEVHSPIGEDNAKMQPNFEKKDLKKIKKNKNETKIFDDQAKNNGQLKKNEVNEPEKIVNEALEKRPKTQDTKHEKVKKPEKIDKTETKEKLKKPVPPPSVSEIVNKHRNYNLNQLLINKNSDFKSLMQEYLRRQCLNENTKVFIISGQYEYLRKVLISKGWVENTHTTSQAYDLKWSYNDSDQDYKYLKAGQFFNHFPNNRELTTKSGLHKNLRGVTDYGTNIDEFYPRTYDLGDTVQIQEFQKDYIRTSAFNIVKNYSNAFKASIQSCINLEILKLAIRISQKYIQEHSDPCEVSQPEWEFSEDVIRQVIEFSEKEFPGEYNNTWDYPSQNLVDLTASIDFDIQKNFPQTRMEGCKNIWIIKPGLNARGSGVKCMQGLNNILDYGAQLQARVVQKYVENPLLINSNKFDIRQWVLVTSYEPLTVYFFNNCYLRLCQLAFNLDSLEVFRHLANYSLQKSIAKNPDETVWTLSRFIDYLKNFGQSWELILGKIHLLVIKTLQAVRDSIESRPECFELYGFDIILDGFFTPWLLEVNLSPACAERTDWLSEMLNEMASGLINIIFDTPTTIPLYDSSLKLLRPIEINTNEWIFLYKGEDIPHANFENIIYGQLEICGEKLNLKKEKLFDKKFLINKAVVCIQKFTRGMLVRKKIKREKDDKIALVIQKLFRRRIAWERLDKQVRLVSCIRIQSAFRAYKAKKILRRLKTIKYVKYIQARLKGYYKRVDFKKLKVKNSIQCIQKCIRVKISLGKIQKERKIAWGVRIIQKKWKKIWKTLNKKAKIIQKIWKKHFTLITKSSIKIQKLIRGRLSRKKYANLKKLKKTSGTIKSFLRIYLSKQVLLNKAKENSIKLINKLRVKTVYLRYFYSYTLYKSILSIQKAFRRYLIKKKFKRLSETNKVIVFNVEFIQKSMKGYISRANFCALKRNYSAILIQKNYKGYKARKYYQFLFIVHESARVIQRSYRAYRNNRKRQMQIRIKAQELERKKRMQRLQREQEIKGLKASERLHSSYGILKAPSLTHSKYKIFKPYKPYLKKKSKKEKTATSPINNASTFRVQVFEKIKKTKAKNTTKDLFGEI